MSVPKSVIRLNKNGFKFVSSVDYVQYTIDELTRAALRDVGKYLVSRCKAKVGKLKGFEKKKGEPPNRRVFQGSNVAFQYWARKIEGDLQVGIKHDTWYGVDQELGANKQPRREILRSTVLENIETIIEIEKAYLTAIEDDPERLIAESKHGGDTE